MKQKDKNMGSKLPFKTVVEYSSGPKPGQKGRTISRDYGSGPGMTGRASGRGVGIESSYSVKTPAKKTAPTNTGAKKAAPAKKAAAKKKK